MQLDTRWCIVFLTSYTSDICMGLIGNTCFKGTPGVLKHYSGLPMANPGGLLKERVSVNRGGGGGRGGHPVKILALILCTKSMP